MECRRGLATRKLSVRPSVCQTHGLWQNERKICPYFYTIRKIFCLVVCEEEWLVGTNPSMWNFGSTGPRWSEIADFELIFARRASAVPSSEKRSINTNRKSTTRFPMSLRWSSYVVPKSEKRKSADFGKKSHFAWRKSATKFCVKTVSSKVVRHSLP